MLFSPTLKRQYSDYRQVAWMPPGSAKALTLDTLLIKLLFSIIPCIERS